MTQRIFDNSELGVSSKSDLVKANIESQLGNTIILTEEQFAKAVEEEDLEVYEEVAVFSFRDNLLKAIGADNDSEDIEKTRKDLSKLIKTTVVDKDGVKRIVYVKRKEYKSHTEGNRAEIEATIKRQESLLANPKSPASAKKRAQEILTTEKGKLAKHGMASTGEEPTSLPRRQWRTEIKPADSKSKASKGAFDNLSEVPDGSDGDFEDLSVNLALRVIDGEPDYVLNDMDRRNYKINESHIEQAKKLAKKWKFDKEFHPKHTGKALEYANELKAKGVDFVLPDDQGQGWTFYVKNQDTPVTVAKEDRSAEFKIPEKPKEKLKPLTTSSNSLVKNASGSLQNISEIEDLDGAIEHNQYMVEYSKPRRKEDNDYRGRLEMNGYKDSIDKLKKEKSRRAKLNNSTKKKVSI